LRKCSGQKQSARENTSAQVSATSIGALAWPACEAGNLKNAAGFLKDGSMAGV
jgi:hypothetical protein